MSRASNATALWHVAAVALLCGLAALIFWPAFGFLPYFPPFGPDNVYALHLGAYSDPGSFFTEADQVWRPITYSTLWAQYEISGLDVDAFFSVNIVLWIVVASLVYVLVYVHTHLVLAAAAAAFITLTDPRTFSPLILIIERQTTLACTFGLLAMLVAYLTLRAERASRVSLAGIVVLLFLAAISKEFGLAFTFGVAAVGFFNRRRDLLLAGLGTFLAYWILRGLIGGLHFGSGVAGSGGSGGDSSDSGLCETMGFGANPRDICYGDLSLPGQIAQYAWNVGSSFVGILMYPVIHSNGYLLAPDFLGTTLGGPSDYEGFTVASVIVPCVITAVAIVGWWKRPAISLPFLVIIVANAVLCFQYYRPRLIVVGMVALHISAGIGIPPALEILKRQLSRVTTRTAAPAVMIAVLLLCTGVAISTRADDLADALDGARGSHATRDPCDAVEVYDITEMPNRLKEKYDLPGGRCTPAE